MKDNLQIVSFHGELSAGGNGTHKWTAWGQQTLVGMQVFHGADSGNPTGFNVDLQDDTADVVTAVAANSSGDVGTWITPMFGGSQVPVAIASGSVMELDVNLVAGSTPKVTYQVHLYLLMGG